MPSSNGELTVQLETRTFLQQSISKPSRFVSTFKLSIVKLSTPVASIANHPPCKIEMSLMITFLQSSRLIALLGLASPFLSASYQTFSPYHSCTNYRNVMQIFAPDKTIVPMTVAVILVSIICTLFGFIKFG
jgi:hypothetical protein